MKNPRGLKELPHWTKFLWSLEQIQNPRPLFYEIDLTNYCNWNCSWCVTKEAVADMESQTKAHQNMEWDMFMRIIDEAADKRCGIVFTGGGEPTLHPDFEQMLDIVISWNKKGRIPGIGLVTNGGIDWKKIKYYLDRTTDPPAWVRISVNAFKIQPELLSLISEFPYRIGISSIYNTEKELELCQKNKELLEVLPVKFIRGPKKAHQWDKPTIEPMNCMGRKFHKVFEVDGNNPYCCLARGRWHKMPRCCPEGCPWNIDFNTLWEANPFS